MYRLLLTNKLITYDNRLKLRLKPVLMEHYHTLIYIMYNI